MILIIIYCHCYCHEDLVHEPTCFKQPYYCAEPQTFKKINKGCLCVQRFSQFRRVYSKHLSTPQKPLKVIYRSHQNFYGEKFKNDVSQIPFHICSIFNDVSDQFWSQKVLFTDLLNAHAPLKEGALTDGHVSVTHSELRKQIQKKNMLKHKHKKDLPNYWKCECFRDQRYKTVSMRKNN